MVRRLDHWLCGAEDVDREPGWIANYRRDGLAWCRSEQVAVEHHRDPRPDRVLPRLGHAHWPPQPSQRGGDCAGRRVVGHSQPGRDDPDLGRGRHAPGHPQRPYWSRGECGAISPDGTWIATASGDSTVRTWDADGAPRATLAGRHNPVYAVAISPDGTWLATASRDGTARTWDAASGALRATLTGHRGPVYAVAISPDGTWLSTGSRDRTARIWDAASGAPRAILTGHRAGISAMAISPDGTWLATASADSTGRIWDVAKRGGTSSVAMLRADGRIRACAWPPSGLLLAGERGLYWLSLVTQDGHRA